MCAKIVSFHPILAKYGSFEAQGLGINEFTKKFEKIKFYVKKSGWKNFAVFYNYRYSDAKIKQIDQNFVVSIKATNTSNSANKYLAMKFNFPQQVFIIREFPKDYSYDPNKRVALNKHVAWTFW